MVTRDVTLAPATARWATRLLASTLGWLLAACGGSVAAHGGPDASDAGSGGGGGGDGPGADGPIIDGTLVDAADGGIVVPDGGGGRVPVNHRPNDNQCLGSPPAGNCMGGAGMLGGNFKCLQDSDCTAGINGRCREPGGPVGCYCSYDTCMQAADCPTGQTCACHGSPYNNFGNTCVAGNCRVDSDCGASGYCSDTVPAGGYCGNVAGYYYHTPNDLCLDDTDCYGKDAGTTAGVPFCEYSTMNRRWECQPVAVCL